MGVRTFAVRTECGSGSARTPRSIPCEQNAKGLGLTAALVRSWNYAESAVRLLREAHGHSGNRAILLRGITHRHVPKVPCDVDGAVGVDAAVLRLEDLADRCRVGVARVEHLTGRALHVAQRGVLRDDGPGPDHCESPELS